MPNRPTTTSLACRLPLPFPHLTLAEVDEFEALTALRAGGQKLTAEQAERWVKLGQRRYYAPEPWPRPPEVA